MQVSFPYVYVSRRLPLTSPHAKGTGWTRWTLIDAAGLARWREEARNVDCFVSIQHYGAPQRADGSRGLHLAPLYFDFDAADLAEALAEVRRLVRFFLAVYDLPAEAIRVWYSGHRGFHVIIDADALGIEPGEDLTYVLKLWALQIAEQLEMATLDRKVYSNPRLWRLPDSCHSKTRLFKVELTHAELLGLEPDAIRTLARQPRGPLYGGDDLDFSPNPDAAADFAHWRDAHRNQQREGKAVTADELAELVGGADPPCIRALLTDSVPRQGEANSALLQLAAYWKVRGASESDCKARLKVFALAIPDYRLSSHRSDREREASAASVVHSVYGGQRRYDFWPEAVRSLFGDCPAPGKCKLCALRRPRPKVGLVPAAQMPPRRIDAFLPLATARARMAGQMERVLRLQAKGLHTFTGSPGSGKTQTMLNVLADLLERYEWPIDDKGRPVRITILVDNSRQLDELLDKMPETLRRMVGVLRGRSGDEASPFFCPHLTITEALGRRRHVPAVDACLACPDAAACELHGFQGAVQEALACQVVVAPKAALLSDYTERLKQFAVIVVDEALLPHLLDDVTIPDFDISRWQENIAELARRYPGRYYADHPIAELLRMVRQALAHTRAHRDQRTRFVDVLREVASSEGVNLAELLDRAFAVPMLDSKRRRYDFEMPGKPWDRTWQGAPLRAARDLVEALWAERHRGPEADTRAWLVRQEDGQAAIELKLVRQKLLRTLRQRCIINLDGTPSPLLRADLLGMGVETYEAPVRQAVSVAQFVDGRFTLSSLKGRNGAVARRMSQAVDAALRVLGSERPAVFTFKALKPSRENAGNIALSLEHPAVQWGHFGGSDRGLDEYAGCDAMAVVGLFCSNIGALEARVQALRFAKEAPKGEPSEARALYEYRDAEGNGRDHPIKVHPDPDVQAVIEHSMASTVIQTAGRLRAACRTREDGRPFPVVLFTAQPIRGLPVDQLRITDDLLQQDRTGAFEQARDAHNAQRWAEAEAKLQAARALGVSGTRALVKATGLSEHTVIAHQRQSDVQAGSKALHTGVYYINRHQPATPSSSLTSPLGEAGPSPGAVRRPYRKPSCVSIPSAGVPAFVRAVAARDPTMAAELEKLLGVPVGGET